jgi:hypothetical protein
LKELFAEKVSEKVCNFDFDPKSSKILTITLTPPIQVKMIPYGLENLHTIDEAARRKSYELAQRGGGGVDSKTEGGPDGSGDKKKRKWTVGELDFEALMRMLDNAVCRKNEDRG